MRGGLVAGWILTVVCVAASGCSRLEGSRMRLTAVEPAVVSSLVETVARIEGDNLYGRLRVSIDDRDAPSLDRDWHVELVGLLSLQQVTWLDETALEVVLPSGLPA